MRSKLHGAAIFKAYEIQNIHLTNYFLRLRWIKGKSFNCILHIQSIY